MKIVPEKFGLLVLIMYMAMLEMQIYLLWDKQSFFDDIFVDFGEGQIKRGKLQSMEPRF